MTISRIKVKFISIAALILLGLLLKKMALDKLALDYNQEVAVRAQNTPASPSADYMRELQRRIKAVWRPPHLMHDTEDTVTF